MKNYILIYTYQLKTGEWRTGTEELEAKNFKKAFRDSLELIEEWRKENKEAERIYFVDLLKK